MKPLFITLGIIVGVYLLIVLINAVAFVTPRYNKKKYKGDLHENHLDVAEYKPFKGHLFKRRAFLYKADNPKGLVVFCHGIGTSSDYYIPEALKWRELGYNVYMFDYRGYWKNKGLFCGVTQVLYDLRYALDFIDDGTLPITLMGHSLGGFAVQSVCKILKKKHNIKNIISVSGFSGEFEVLEELFDKIHVWKGIRWLFHGFLFIGQTTFFGNRWLTKAYKVIDEHPEINNIVIQSIDDKDVLTNGSAIYNKLGLLKNRTVHSYLFEDKPYNTHMGVIRGAGKGKVNEILFEYIERNI